MPPLAISPAGRRYGYLRDKPDARDFGVRTFALSVSAFGVNPSSVDLEEFCGPVRDQGNEGSCTAHAGVGMREFLAAKYQNQYPILSPAFLYYQERKFDGSLDQGDCGSFGRTVVHVLNTDGCCRLAEEPYHPGDFMTPPTPEQLEEALEWKGGAYHRIAAVEDMKSCLASGYVFCIGFSVYDSFEKIGADGLWNPNKLHEGMLGGHEVLAIGYDDAVNGGCFKVRNSWGLGWGAKGNFWMRYSDAADPDVLMDGWIQHLGRPWRAGTSAKAKPKKKAKRR